MNLRIDSKQHRLWCENHCPRVPRYLEPIHDQFSDDGGINYALGVCYLTAESADEKAAREYTLKAQEVGISIPADVLNAINEK